jgi:hypothetical protein
VSKKIRGKVRHEHGLHIPETIFSNACFRLWNTRKRQLRDPRRVLLFADLRVDRLSVELVVEHRDGENFSLKSNDKCQSYIGRAL